LYFTSQRCHAAVGLASALAVAFLQHGRARGKAFLASGTVKLQQRDIQYKGEDNRNMHGTA
jgi:hypothetical protein